MGDECISHCYRRGGMGLCWAGAQSSAQPFAKAGFPHWDSGKYLLAKRLIKRKSLGMFHQECCLGRGSAWPGAFSPSCSRGSCAGSLNRAQLGCGDCTDLHKILSSRFLLRSSKIESAGSSDSKASKSLGFSECESRNFSAALGRFPSTLQVSPSSPHLALQVGQRQSW